MTQTRTGRTVTVAAAIGAALALAACATPPQGAGAYYCTTSIGSLPDFWLTDFSQGYEAVRPGSGGVTVVEVPIAGVQPGDFDYVLWDALQRVGYGQPPDTMEFYVEQNPTFGTASTVLRINVYDWTPVGTYELKVRGLAHQGSFYDSTGDELVGECFHDFELRVRD